MGETALFSASPRIRKPRQGAFGQTFLCFPTETRAELANDLEGRPTTQRVGWTATGPGPARTRHSLGFVLVGELAQVPHYPETRASPGGYLSPPQRFSRDQVGSTRPRAR